MTWALMLRYLAAEPTSTGIWGQPVVIALLALAGVLATAAGGFAGTVLVKRMNRSIDDATVKKTAVEGRKFEAETISLEVATARGLIAEIESMMKRQREDADQRIDGLKEQNDAAIKQLLDRIAGVESREREVRAAFASHATWDMDAIAILRSVQPDFPEPPPVRFD